MNGVCGERKLSDSSEAYPTCCSSCEEVAHDAGAGATAGCKSRRRRDGLSNRRTSLSLWQTGLVLGTVTLLCVGAVELWVHERTRPMDRLGLAGGCVHTTDIA